MSTLDGHPAGGPPRSRTNRWLVVALTASLCLNCLIVGIVIGRLAVPQGRLPFAAGFQQRPPLPRGIEMLINTIPPNVRPAVRGRFMAARPAIMARLHAIGVARHGVGVALAAQPFVPAALDDALARLRAANADAQQEIHQVLADALGSLPPADRAAVAQRWRGPAR